MSTSPEAKQAAVEWAKTKSAFGNQGREEFVFAQGYDAATAKLREELELARGLLEEQRSYESIRNTELIQQLVREQLAHQQQPSATDEPLFGEHIKEAVGAIKPLFEPSAPTPEMEQIARETLERVLSARSLADGQDILICALAQSRAPLVEVLKKVRRGLASTPTSFGFKCEVDIIDAALTSTGEK